MKTKKTSKSKSGEVAQLHSVSVTVTLAGLAMILAGLTAATVDGSANWAAGGVVLNIIGVIIVSVGVGMSLSPYLATGKKNGRKD